MEAGRLALCDYAVAFVDLLGQRDAMRSRHLPQDPTEVLALVKNSVGKIVGIQTHFQTFFDAFTSRESLYQRLPEDIKAGLPDFAPGELRWQRFSDGFVIYIPLGEGLVRSPASSIFGMLMASGSHCLTGLAAGSPLRIGIDAAWGVEYREGELYGSALAHAYELESNVAQWPRVVIGEGLVEYLKHYLASASSDLSSQARAAMAEQCLRVISPDRDGQDILHYLGQPFRQAAGNAVGVEVVERAFEFIQAQVAHWRESGNEKLEKRYLELSTYFTEYSGG